MVAAIDSFMIMTMTRVYDNDTAILMHVILTLRKY